MSEAQHKPVAGQDYPQTWSQFEDWFASEIDCLRYLERLRWPEGFVCPRCGRRDDPYRADRARLICRACRLQCTVTSGTIFDKTRTPLKVWLAAAWYLTSQKSGVSALGLQRVLGLGSYQTAWTMLHRFRRAMVRPGRERLKGTVEIDQSYLAIREHRKSARSAGESKRTTKALIVIAVEIQEPKGFGRIRLRRIDEESVADVLPFVKEVVAPGSVIRTDGAPIYFSLGYSYGHERTVVKSVTRGSLPPAHVALPGVHRVASLLKRWLLGTHQGAVKPVQLDYYLDEFVFRFNRRTSRSRGLLFYRLLEQAVMTDPITYNDVARKSGAAEHPDSHDANSGAKWIAFIYTQYSREARWSTWSGSTTRRTGKRSTGCAGTLAMPQLPAPSRNAHCPPSADAWGVRTPEFSVPRRKTSSPVAEHSLAIIRGILVARTASAKPTTAW